MQTNARCADQRRRTCLNCYLWSRPLRILAAGALPPTASTAHSGPIAGASAGRGGSKGGQGGGPYPAQDVPGLRAGARPATPPRASSRTEPARSAPAGPTSSGRQNHEKDTRV